MRKGIIIGKFWPFHKGHELLIRTAMRNMDKVYIIVSQSEENFEYIHKSANAIKAYCNVLLTHNLTIQNITIIEHFDESPEPISVDENGTVLDDEFQEYWCKVFSQYKPTHIISSDMYGKVLAERMGIEWFPVDPKREFIPISGTEIRENLIGNFEFISNYAKRYFRKTIALVGSESCGKSTMAKDLSAILGAYTVPEYGRTLSENKSELNEQDFLDIMNTQAEFISHARDINVTSPFVITDTEAYITYLYSKIYLDSPMEEILEFAKYQHVDLFVVLAPTVPWKDDGTRIVGETEQRTKFHNDLIQLLSDNNENYVIIDDIRFNDRLVSVINHIEEMCLQVT